MRNLMTCFPYSHWTRILSLDNDWTRIMLTFAAQHTAHTDVHVLVYVVKHISTNHRGTWQHRGCEPCRSSRPSLCTWDRNQSPHIPCSFCLARRCSPSPPSASPCWSHRSFRPNPKNNDELSAMHPKMQKKWKEEEAFGRLIPYHPLNKAYGAYSSAICMTYLYFRLSSS